MERGDETDAARHEPGTTRALRAATSNAHGCRGTARPIVRAIALSCALGCSAPGVEASAVLVPADGAADDGFGVSIAVSADGTVVLVGAPWDDTAATASPGSAYVFRATAAGWTEEQRFVASDAADGDQFGISVALTADGERALVGASRHDTVGGDEAGAAYVFERTERGWVEVAALTASDGARSEQFGNAVALSGDGTRLIVGVHHDETARGPGVGSARVFVLGATGWTMEATLLAPDGETDDFFAESVALSADGSRALVGVYADDTSDGTNAGSGRVFVRRDTPTGTVWTQEAVLRAAGGSGSEYFGTSVALDEGGTRALLGGTGDATLAGEFAGSVRVFVRTDTTWTEEATLADDGGAAHDLFGNAVALSADGRRAIVGAYLDDLDDRPNVGSAHAFTRGSDGWVDGASFAGPDADRRDNFGVSVALGADGTRVLVGAYNRRVWGGSGFGRVWVIEFEAP